MTCVCNGECLCHIVGGLGAQEHPIDCSASGFDICHLCNCVNNGINDVQRAILVKMPLRVRNQTVVIGAI